MIYIHKFCAASNIRLLSVQSSLGCMVLAENIYIYLFHKHDMHRQTETHSHAMFTVHIHIIFTCSRHSRCHAISHEINTYI